MIYLRYITIIIFKLVAKVFGLLWFYVVYNFRGYARNRVYNYVLQNKIYLSRLTDRKPVLKSGYYILEDIHKLKERNDIDVKGRIKYKKVSWLEYQFCFWFIWGWVDDDSNHDTMSGDKRKDMIYGNSFDLGDTRAKYPEFKLKESTLWLLRNTAYNFNYMLEECLPDSKYFFYNRFTNKYFDWHFGYLPKGNKRAGRMVWFTEDIDKV